MSFQYPYIDHYSPSPTTSTTPQGFAQWDLQDDQLSPNAQQQASSEPSPTTYEPPATIQLQERTRRNVSRDFKHLNRTSNPATPTGGAVRFDLEPSPPHHDSAPAGNASDSTGPVRQHSSNRAQARLSQHPYRRASSGSTSASRASESGAMTQTGQEHDPIQSVTAYATMAFPTSRLQGLGLKTNRYASGAFPLRMLVNFFYCIPSAPSPAEHLSALGRRFMIRTDMHFSAETNMLTAMLELPGVKKSDLSITLRICPYSRVKQLSISGRSGPLFSDDGYTLRERKYGVFTRTLLVPPDTTAKSVSAAMQDGILVLRMPAGTPVHCDDEMSQILIS